MIGNRDRASSWQALMGALAVVFATIAITAETQGAPRDERIARVGPERALGGITIEESLNRQAQLHDLLMSEMPVGYETAPIQVDLDQQDRDLLAEPAQNGKVPLRIGVVKAVAGVEVVGGQAFKHGVAVENRDGGFVWATKVTSPGAQAIRVHFQNFSLPDNAELYFLNLEGQVDGPYTGKGRNGDGDFWTRSMSSDSGVIMIRFTGAATKADRRQISFVISDVGHISGRLPGGNQRTHDTWPCSDNAPCLIDATCVNAGPAESAKDAVAKMEWIAGCCINTCSGGLLADTDGSSQIPLFLTANHCVSKSISNMEFFFNYTTSSCNGTCPHNVLTGGAPAPSAVGFTVLASGRSGDYTLGQLDQAPPSGVVFLGWNSSPIAFTDGAGLWRISNANFGPQVFSEHAVDTSAGTCRSWPRGERIYSADIQGATMGGSSGSPVVNSAGEVVGQLSGCCGFNCADECDAASNSTVDGALAHYFADVSSILDPQGGGGGCTSDADCDDGDPCNGAETCVSGTCQNGSAPPCQNGDGCCPSGCDSGNDDDCVACGGNKAPCATDADCCSNNCKNGGCKGG